MGFNLAGYGIHGTTEPETIGKQATQGCIRMVNSDVEELYAIVPEGTEVTIVD
jgi:lipoprotein-anchoring transpeptidase ErfK/SrfK